MCYYNGQRVSLEEFIRLVTIEKELAKLDFLNRPIISGFEYGPIAVLKATENKDDFDIVQMEWGFLPSYIRTREDAEKMRRGYKDATGKFVPALTTLNAKGEEMLLPKKMFRNAALNNRCLVISSGFFEWQHFYPLNKKTGQPIKTATKYPYFIGMKDCSYFFMAGIYQPWTDRETGETIDTVSIVTTDANPLMKVIHNSKNRMPVILDEARAWRWLFDDLSEEEITELATYQAPYEGMRAWTVEKDFRSAPDPTIPFSYQGLPTLEQQLAGDMSSPGSLDDQGSLF